VKREIAEQLTNVMKKSRRLALAKLIGSSALVPPHSLVPLFISCSQLARNMKHRKFYSIKANEVRGSQATLDG